MDSDQKYIEALKRAVAEYKDEDKHLKATLERIFPELKDEVDELTWLTNYISEEAYCLSMDIRDKEDSIRVGKLQKSLAWLKKQAEVKPVEWTKEDENGLGDALWAIKQARTIAKNENEMGGLWYAERWLNTIKDKIQSKQSNKPQDKTALEAVEEEKNLPDFENAMMRIGESFFGKNAGLNPNDTDTIKEQE